MAADLDLGGDEFVKYGEFTVQAGDDIILMSVSMLFKVSFQLHPILFLLSTSQKTSTQI
jgi:hypothetical protein